MRYLHVKANNGSRQVSGRSPGDAGVHVGSQQIRDDRPLSPFLSHHCCFCVAVVYRYISCVGFTLRGISTLLWQEALETQRKYAVGFCL